MANLGLFFDSSHDSNICLSDEATAKITFAVAEERLSRQIQDGRIPRSSMRLARQHSPIKPAALAIAGRSEEDSRKQFQQVGRFPLCDTLYELRERALCHLELNNVERVYVPHLYAHAATAFLCSSFPRAYVLVADGGNAWDPWTCALFRGDSTQLRCLYLGTDDFTDLYMFATAFLGFRPNRHEGKVTGLAAWGAANPTLRTRIMDLIDGRKRTGRALSSGLIRWKNIDSNPQLTVNREGLQQVGSNLSGYSREELAYEVQRTTEDEVIAFLKQHLPCLDLPLCVAGGLFANIKLNQRLLQLGFPGIYIHPAMGDAGLAVGAVAAMSGETLALRTSLDSVLLGPSYSEDRIEAALHGSGLAYRRSHDIQRAVARALADGKTVAFFGGRLEYGPRALGNRSILCSAQSRSQIERLNATLHRDEFMPFAPAILAEHFLSCIDGGERYYQPCLWMTISATASAIFKAYAPELVHVDGTIRPQCVTKDLYPRLHAIIEEYYAITRVPIILNTSFNLHGEPIVCSPEDAISTFVRTNIDLLVLEDFIVNR